MDQQEHAMADVAGLTAEEQQRLTTGILSPEACLPQLLVPFELVAAQGTAVAWLNTRWFTERGFDLTNASIRTRLEQWLVNRFAYVVPSLEHSGQPWRGFEADRYGSTDGLSPHGGSGRVATQAHFQVKGVGRTPLVGRDTSGGHAHGCLSLAEALREAVYSEIAAAEFPFGAVPILAVLDIGMRFSSPDKSEKFDQDVRRGLVVRPFTLRPAHIERAPCFRGTGDVRTAQRKDAERVAGVVAWWECQLSAGDESIVTEPRELFYRIGRQIGFGHAHRLFNGGYFSSNLSTTGALLDFGNMHWLPRWHRIKVLPHAPGFGDEMKVIRKMAHSLTFFFNRHMRAHPCVDATSLIEATESGIRAERGHHFSLFMGEPNHGDVSTSCLTRTFADDTRVLQQFEFGVPVDGSSTSQALPSIVLRAVNEARDHLLKPMETPDAELLEINLERYLGDRYLIDRAQLISAMRVLVNAALSDPDSGKKRINTVLTGLVSNSRRYWPRISDSLVVLRSVVKYESSALLCLDRHSKRYVLWLEGVSTTRGGSLFGSAIERADLVAARVRFEDPYWTAQVDANETAESSSSPCAQLGAACVMLPPWQVHFTEHPVSFINSSF